MLINDITKLLKLEGVVYKDFTELDERIIIHLERIDKRPTCRCGNKNIHINEWRTHKVTDLPFHNKSVKLHIRKQRYYCPCCKTKITGSLSMVSKHKHHTKRIIPLILTMLTKNTTFKDCAKELSISITTTMRLFDQNIDFERPFISPTVLHIDEFKGNANNEKFQLGIINGQTKKVFDILENRHKKTLKEYLSKLKNEPEVVVIDMWLPYKEVINSLWKNCVVVADKFHYVRQVLWAVRDVRTRIQKSNENGKRIKKYWKLFMINSNNLKYKQKIVLEELLSYDLELKEVYKMKEIFDKTISCQNGCLSHENFDNWLDILQTSHLPELVKLRKTFENWYSEVVSSFYYNYTNGVAEGINNRIKVIKRQSYGIKKFDNLRNLIMLRIS